MTKMRKKKKNLKKSDSNKSQGYKAKSQKQMQNNIFYCEKIFEELESSSNSNAERIEKEILEKIDNKQNNLTDFDEKLSQIKSTNETDNFKKYIKICLSKTIIKLRRENLLSKRLNNLDKNRHKKNKDIYKLLEIKNIKIEKNNFLKFRLKIIDNSLCESITKETPNINKKQKEIKPELKDKKIDKKKSLIKEHKKEDVKYISKTEKAEDKKICISIEENNNNGDNMSLSLSENNNNEQIQNEENNNNIHNMSISSLESNTGVFIYTENNTNSEGNNNGTEINNQNPTETNVIENYDNNLDDDYENNNVNIVGMNDYVNFVNDLNNVLEEEYNNINNNVDNNDNVDGNDDVFQNPNVVNCQSNKKGIK